MSLECEKAASAHEKHWRKKNFPSIQSVSSQDKRCSACGECVLLVADHCFINRIVGTIQCRPCHDHFEAVEPWKTSTSQSLCIICGYEKIDRYQCAKNDCSYAVCKSCVVRNSPGSMIDIEKQEWTCFVCCITQLYRSRAIAAVVMTKLAEQSKKDQSEMAEAPKNQTLKQVLTVSDSDASSEPVVLISKIQTKRPKKSSVEPSTSHASSTMRSTRAQTRTTARVRVSSASSSSASESDKKTLQRKARTRALDKIRKASQKQKLSSKRKVPIVKPIEKLNRQNSNSGSEKEFSKHKIIESYVPLKRLRDLEKDYTLPVEDKPVEITENLTQHVAFHLKNIIRNFCKDLKLEGKQMINEAEKIEKNYNYASQLTISDSVLAIMDCKKVRDDIITSQTNGNKKLDDQYDKWCKKASIKNIFSSDEVTESKESVAGPSRKLTTVEEQNEKSSGSDTKTTKVNTKPTEVNGMKSLDTDSDSDSTIRVSINEEPKSLLRNTSTPISDAPPIPEKSNNSHSVSRTPVDMFSDEPESKSASKKRGTSSSESEFELPPRPHTPSRNDSSDQSVATVILDLNSESTAKDLSEMVRTLSPIAPVDNLDSTGSVVESSFNKDDEQLPAPKVTPSRAKDDPARKPASDSSSDTDIECAPRIGSQAAVLTLTSGSDSGKDDAAPLVTVKSVEKINSSLSQSEKTKPRDASPPPASKNDETHEKAVDAEQKNERTPTSKPVVVENIAVGKEAAVNFSESNSGLPLAEKDAGTPGAAADTVVQPSETMETDEPISSDPVQPHSVPQIPENLGTVDGGVLLNGVSDIMEQKKAAKARLLNESSDSEQSGCDSPAATDIEENVVINNSRASANRESSPEPGENSRASANRESSPEPGEIVNSTEVFRPKINRESGEKETEDIATSVPKSSPKKSRKNGVDLAALEKQDIEARAKKSLLATSSESESERPSRVSSPSVDDNDNLKKSHKNTHQTDSDTRFTEKSSEIKYFRFDKRNNKYYRSDSKLRAKCRVKLETLPQRILAQHENILRRQKDYREYREIQSLVSIENLEASKKRHQDGNSSTDGENSPKIRHKKKKSRVEDDEDLLDHLKKVTDGNMSEAAEGEGVQSDDNDNEKSETPRNNSQDVMLAGDSLMKASLLASSDSEKENPPQEEEEEEEDAGEDVSSKNTTTPASKKSTPQKADSENETVSQKKSKSNWRRHKLLTATLSSTDSEAEDEKIGQRLSQREAKVNSDSDVIISDSSPTKQKKIRPRRRRLTSDTDSPIQLSDSDSDAGVFQKKEPIKVDKQIRKRRATSDLSDDSSSSREIVKTKTRKRIKVHKDSDESSGDDDPNQSQSKGRKNIRKVIKDKQVAEDTKAAARDEEERLKRIAERQKVYNAIHEMRIASEEKVEKLVLDFDETTKEPILSVDEALVKKLKPHQAQGIKFMWNACFESVERAKTTSGTGCILAHCMGLGKSFQVVTLAFTLLINYELTGVHKILIVAPLSTVLNWKNEFKMWLSEVKNGDDIEIYEMTKAKSIHERRYILEYWQKSGGVMIMGYEMYRNLTNVAVANQKKEKKKDNAKAKKVFNTALVDPGPDLVICDEGHLLKNEESAISKAMKRVSTLRRIVLTGTPLQNNLREYHCMVQFVKPNLLGSKKEFFNRFVNPIQNGQFDDSTEYDVKIMKKRAHVLHKMLEGSVQRFDYSVLTPFLPPKQEYVILVKLTSVQQKMYLHYLENHTRLHKGGGGSLFADFQALQRIWTHPIVVKQQAEARAKLVQKKREEESDSEGSIKDFIDDGSLSSNSSSSGTDASSNTSGSSKAKKPGPPKRSTRANPVEPSKDEEPEAEEESEPPWWPQFVSESDYDDMRVSGKLILLFDIIKECEAIGDKILIFSQSLYSLTLIEKFLAMIDEETQNNSLSDNLDKHSGRWVLGQDYFRIDGQTSSDNRSIWVKSFNRPSNTQARLFLISTRAGGLGINLTAANRVVIFDASWNPSHDVQSIFRIYRFGQKKPCYVYRLLAAGTMEEKIYNRQVTKLSLSCRVVDEQQIERHFSNNDLAELYRFDPPKDPAPTLPLPKDRMWADILLRHRDLVETYLEHDSLLENIAEEMLDEEERKQAWLEYEEEKAGKRPPPVLYNQQQLQMQQQAMQFANDMMQQIPMSNFDLTKLTPGLPGLMQAYEQMATNPALSMNMQNYSFTDFNQSVLVPNPLHGNKSAQAAMLQQLPQQRVSLSNMTAQQQVAYAQKFGNNLPSVTIRPAAPRPNPVPRTVDISEDEVVEIPAPSRTAAQVGAGKRQEE